MGKLANSWDVTKATFSIMKLDGELYLYPVFSSVLSVILIVALIISGILALFVAPGSTTMFVFYVFVFIAYVGLALINSFFLVATSYTAACRFRGENATIKNSFAFCFSRFGTIFKWAVLAGTVGLLLKLIESAGKKGRGQIISSIVSKLLGLAWAVVTTFVIPVIVYENLTPFPAIKRSVEILKKTWGESLIKWAGITVIRSTANLIAFLALIIPGIFLAFMGSLLGAFILISLGILVMVVVSLVLGIADEVFDTALYVYATTGKIPTGYEEHHMKDSFRVA